MKFRILALLLSAYRRVWRILPLRFKAAQQICKSEATLEGSSEPAHTWDQLPGEVLRLIASKLAPADYQATRTACRYWHYSLPVQHLMSSSLDEAALARICASHPGLISVDLSGSTDLEAASLRHLNHLPHLTALSLARSSSLTKPGLQCLTALANLQELDLSYTDLRWDAVSWFARLSGLVILKIQGSYWQNTVCDLLLAVNKANLESLEIGYRGDNLVQITRCWEFEGREEPDMELLNGLTKLTSLSITKWCESSENMFAGKVGKLTTLRQLVLNGISELTDNGLHELLMGLQRLTSLQLADVGACYSRIRGSGLRALRQHSTLEVLSVAFCRCVTSLDSLAGLQSLRDVDVSHSGVGISHPSGTSLVGLPGMTKLKASVDSLAEGDVLLATLARLTMVLDFSLTLAHDMSNGMLTTLLQLTQLQALNFSNPCQHSYRCNFESLLALPRLHKLELRDKKNLLIRRAKCPRGWKCIREVESHGDAQVILYRRIV